MWPAVSTAYTVHFPPPSGSRRMPPCSGCTKWNVRCAVVAWGWLSGVVQASTQPSALQKPSGSSWGSLLAYRRQMPGASLPMGRTHTLARVCAG